MELPLPFRNLLVAVVVMWFGPARVGTGQWSPGLEVPWNSQVNERQLEAILDSIEFDDQQRAIIQVLFAEHQEYFADFVKRGLAAQKELDAEVNKYDFVTTYDARAKAQSERDRDLSRWANEQAAIDKDFYDTLETVLTEDQAEAWFTFHRDYRWQLLKRYSTRDVPGATVSLHDVVSELDLEQGDVKAVDNLLADYDLVMDGLAQAMFNAKINEARNKWRNHLRIAKMNREMSEEKTLEGVEKALHRTTHQLHIQARRTRQSEIALRRMNDTFATAIEAELPEDKVPHFRKLYQHAKHPEAYQTQTVAHLYAARIKRVVLPTEDQSNAIDVLVTELDRVLESINDDMAAAEERHFQTLAKFPFDLVERMETQQAREKIDEKRDDLGYDYVDRLYRLLRPDQQAKVPKPQRENDASKTATGAP